MVLVSPARSRFALGALGLAGMLLGMAGAATAQYYGYEDDYYGRPSGYGSRYRPLDDYAPVPPRAIGRVAVRDFGMTDVDRMVRTNSAYVVDGRTANGTRTRLIFDSRSGALVDRILLQAPPRPQAAPRVARVDPREDERPAQPRLVPRPPERPAALKPPAQASAPATVAPRPVAAPPAPTPAPASPDGVDKPRLVNPNDVRGSGEPERTPPLAKAEAPVISIPPVTLPPVQMEDIAPRTPQPDTPAVPAAPLE